MQATDNSTCFEEREESAQLPEQGALASPNALPACFYPCTYAINIKAAPVVAAAQPL
jgi:hypothetical protein